jgi:hypothetical protein
MRLAGDALSDNCGVLRVAIPTIITAVRDRFV